MASDKKSNNKEQNSEVPPPAPVTRETLESFAVALILAFLFRAFVAEAFVIPTGSMAPTLMGAHKDVRCPECGCDYQCGASSEFDSESGSFKDSVVVATTCPLCRYELPLDLAGNANHLTFNGDRILVSKFAYMWREPKRWEVIVFKYPMNSRQNYIKRLTGRPNERLFVRHGDIYVQPLDGSSPPAIARKPPNVVQAVLQPVHDTSHLPKSLIKAGMPSSFQPFPLAKDGWNVEQSETKWLATCKSTEAKDQLQWLRYYHHVVNPQVWSKVIKTGSFPAPIKPDHGRLIADFCHYNASLSAHTSYVYDWRPRSLADSITSRAKMAASYQSGVNPRENPEMRVSTDYEGVHDGLHWVGDLASEYEVEILKGTGTLVLDLVEMGLHLQCRIDTSTGDAKLQVLKGETAIDAFENSTGGFANVATTSTNIRGPGKYRLKFANVDDQLILWVGGKIKDFSPSNRFSSERCVKVSERRPLTTPTDPLDMAPVGIAASGIDLNVKAARIWRDIYYAAGQSSPLVDYPSGDTFQKYIDERRITDYALSVDPNFASQRPGNASSRYTERLSLSRDAFFSTESIWANCGFFNERRELEFPLEENQYFPMGDNSTASFDARGWSQHFVPERLLLGRAILVLWPHAWNRPIPMLPNVRRMGLIR